MNVFRISDTECKLVISVAELFKSYKLSNRFYICGLLIQLTQMPLISLNPELVEVEDIKNDGEVNYTYTDLFDWDVTTESFYKQWRTFIGEPIDLTAWDNYFNDWNQHTQYDDSKIPNAGGRDYRWRVLELATYDRPDYEFVIDCELDNTVLEGAIRFKEIVA